LTALTGRALLAVDSDGLVEAAVQRRARASAYGLLVAPARVFTVVLSRGWPMSARERKHNAGVEFRIAGGTMEADRQKHVDSADCFETNSRPGHLALRTRAAGQQNASFRRWGPIWRQGTRRMVSRPSSRPSSNLKQPPSADHSVLDGRRGTFCGGSTFRPSSRRRSSCRGSLVIGRHTSIPFGGPGGSAGSDGGLGCFTGPRDSPAPARPPRGLGTPAA